MRCDTTHWHEAKQLCADVVTHLRQNWKIWSLPARGLPGAVVRPGSLCSGCRGKMGPGASTSCSSRTQTCQVGKCLPRQWVCWAWVLPQLDYPGWAQPSQVCPCWSSGEVKNAELVLALFYQRRLWPIVSLAPDPAQKVSLLHQLPRSPPWGTRIHSYRIENNRAAEEQESNSWVWFS